MRHSKPPKLLLVVLLVLGMSVTTAIAKAAESTIYRIAGLGGIQVGQTINHKPEGSARAKPQPRAWTLRSGAYTPRELIEGFAPLLDTVVYRLGEDAPNARPARAMLLDNVASNLATDTRESTLPFQGNVSDLSRREMKEQAERIGRSLVKWAREASDGPFDPNLNIRSPCENHLLTPPNVELMFGRRSQPHLMQLFNEYMHQMVLLRDALLPFKNYDEVLIPIDGEAARGIRHLEPIRSQFLTGLVTKSVTQKSVLAYAKALLAPNLPRTDTGGYGFQYDYGSVVPAVLSGGETSFHLLEYIPAKLDSSQKDILFDYGFPDYYTAPRHDIPAGTQRHPEDLLKPVESNDPIVQNASLGLVPSSMSASIRQLELRLEFSNGKCANVDVGQIARGHRYAYQASAVHEAGSPGHPAVVHTPLDVLLQPGSGLLTSKHGGVHVIPTAVPIIALAILGKLYPENVVLLPSGSGLNQAERAGKGFEPKFVIWGGAQQGGLKGRF